MKWYVVFAMLVGVVPAFASRAVLREWNDNTGQFSVQAEFVDAKDGQVILKKADGKTIEVPLDRLSSADREYVKQAKAEKQSAKAELFGAESPEKLLEMAKQAVDEDNAELLQRCHCPPSATKKEQAVARGTAHFLLAHKHTQLFLDKAEKRFPGDKLQEAFGEAKLFFDRDMLLSLQFDHMVNGQIEIAEDKAVVRFKRDGGTRVGKRTLCQRDGRWMLSIEGAEPEQTEHCACWLELAKTANAALDTTNTFDDFKAKIAPQVQELAKLRKAARERARERIGGP